MRVLKAIPRKLGRAISDPQHFQALVMNSTSMKNYCLLCVLICTSILSGCGLGKVVTSVALLPVNIATGVVDTVTGTKMTRGLHNAVDEAFKSGQKMEASAIKTAFSNTTFHVVPYTAFLKADGSALLKKKENDTIEQARWTASIGQLCINKDCFEIRAKDREILTNTGFYYKKGDTENFDAKIDAQVRNEAEKRAEAERKKAEEQAAQVRAETEQRIAQQKAEAEEARCMASSQCRAEKERKERERQAEAQREREQACERLYSGKAVEIRIESCGFIFTSDCHTYNYDALITGVSVKNGLATAKIVESGRYYGKTYEKSCSNF